MTRPRFVAFGHPPPQTEFMPRPKQYDTDVVVEKAMHVFWEKGYEATSVQELVDATGINRFSMYQAFGDKHSLFIRALTVAVDPSTFQVPLPSWG